MNTLAHDLRSIRDLLRYALTRFNEAELVFGHGSSSAQDDAIFLILESLKLPLDQLDPWLDARLTFPERERIIALIEERVESRKPTAYLLNRAYLQGVDFYVDERVIVPRSFLAEILPRLASFDEEEDFLPLPSSLERIADLGTGSGCLAILAAMLFPHATVDAVDISEDAIAVAAINIAHHGLGERIRLHKGNLFSPLDNKRYDLILANPPYVDAESMGKLPAEYRHEPRLALDGGQDGLDIVRVILHQAAHHLTKDGVLLCEIGTGRDRLEAAFPHLPFVWLDTAESSGEVFWLREENLKQAAR